MKVNGMIGQISMGFGVVERVKSALIGDVSKYRNETYRADRASNDYVDRSVENTGRVYMDPDVSAGSSKSSALGIGALNLPAKAWKTLRSIGEYDSGSQR